MKIPDTILVVEDDKLLNSILQKTLQKEGFHTEGVHSGEEAINRINSKESSIWLLILDFSLSDMNGKQVIAALARNQQNIPFIIITGHGNENIAVEMMKLGAIDYLLKDKGLIKLIPHVVKRVHRDLSYRNKLLKAEKELHEKTLLSHLLMDSLPCVAFLIKAKTREIIASNKIAIEVGAVPGEHCFSTSHNLKENCPYCLAQATWEIGKAQHQEIEARDKIWDAHWLPVTEDLYLHYAFDITRKKQTDNALIESRERYRRITEAVTDYIYTVNVENGSPVNTKHNEACAAVTGYRKEEFAADPYLWINMVFEEDRAIIHKQSEEVLAGRFPAIIEHRIKRKDGMVRWVESMVVPNSDVNGNLISYDGLLRDIHNRKKAEIQLEQQAFSDQLTNLPNRAMFLKYMEHITKRVERQKDYQFAVLFIDLDRFKIVNDSLGHMIGDQLLISVSKRLELCIRPNDVISRFGGDEFAILLDDINDQNDAIRVANRIQKELSVSFNLESHEVSTSASIGIALSATGYTRIEDILRDADSAMYRAKNLGRARYEIFDKKMHAAAMKLLQMEADLRNALKRKELCVFYQPIISFADKSITGMEALLRWKHPKHGLVYPMDFIPLAEETGLILQIGEWVLRTACEQNRTWHDAGHQDLKMEVNFSARQFQHNDISSLISKTLNETGTAPDCLDIEITESIAMEDHSITALNELARIGVKTSIDDFGTGFSSLASLRRFPIDAIKIDRSFVKDIETDMNSEAIVKAIIAMAHSLNMQVVAEGVETEQQFAFLKSHHCDKMQGFLFSPPVPVDEFTSLLERSVH